MASCDDEELVRYRSRLGDVADEPLRMLPPIEGYQNMPLVSLEEAIEPLFRRVPDVQNCALTAKQDSKNLSKHGLSIDEVASIRLYTMQLTVKKRSLYDSLNEDLRSEDRSKLKIWFLYLKLFMTGLMKIPSSPQNLYRGVKLDLSKEYQSGWIIVWWAFSSCTDTKQVAERFCGTTGARTIFEINCYSGKDVRQYSRYPKENEILLTAATQFKIVSNIEEGNGRIIIKLEETEPKSPLIEKGPVLNDSITMIQRKTQIASIRTRLPSHSPEQFKLVSSASESDQNNRNPEIRRLIDQPRHNSSVVIDGLRVSKDDMRDIVERVIMERRCTQIQISNAHMTNDSILELGKGINKSIALNEVDLSNNHLSDDHLSSLVGELSIQEKRSIEQWKFFGLTKMKEIDCGSIKILNLSSNNISDDGMNHVVALLGLKPTLTDLYLNKNRIGDKGIDNLAKTLSHPTAKLQRLYLSENVLITDPSANYLVDMFEKNRSLTVLWLLNCNFSSAGRQTLIRYTAKKKNFYLNIERYDLK